MCSQSTLEGHAGAQLDTIEPYPNAYTDRMFGPDEYCYARTLYGLSENACILDIVSGEVDIRAVHMILSGTAATTPDEWEQVIASRRVSFWLPFPDAAEAVFRTLLAEGRVIQPLLTGDLLPDLTQGVWVADSNTIRWVDQSQ